MRLLWTIVGVVNISRWLKRERIPSYFASRAPRGFLKSKDFYQKSLIDSRRLSIMFRDETCLIASIQSRNCFIDLIKFQEISVEVIEISFEGSLSLSLSFSLSL
jgi:hypothetical protein